MQRDQATTHWHKGVIGNGQVQHEDGAIHLAIAPTDAQSYHDAQISDYHHAADFRWRPPLRLRVQAHSLTATAQHQGTGGFGFWNQPFMPNQRWPRLPQTLWFFFSSAPNNMQLANGVNGPGWKSATLDATRWQFLALAPFAPVGVLMMRNTWLYQRLWPIGQHAIGVSETSLDTSLLQQSHQYQIDWYPDHAAFFVDGDLIHHSPSAPKGPLGFIAWWDNQYAIVTPQGRFGFGLMSIDHPQSLILDAIQIEPL